MSKIEQLYKTYQEDVYGYLVSLTKDPSLSEDLLSETFLRAMQSLAKFRGESSIKTWLFGIARHVWLQELAKRRPTVEYQDLLEVYMGDGVMDTIVNRQAVVRIHQLLEEKDERTRQIVYSRVMGMSYQEIGQKLGISENSARVINFRTRRWMKEQLEKEGLL